MRVALYVWEAQEGSPVCMLLRCLEVTPCMPWLFGSRSARAGPVSGLRRVAGACAWAVFGPARSTAGMHLAAARHRGHAPVCGAYL